MNIVKKTLKLGLLPKKLIKGNQHKKNYTFTKSEELIESSNFSFSNCKKLLVVAHPDDEVIFAGNYLLNNRDTLVVCLTNVFNKVRSAEFKNVMNALELEYLMFDFPDCEFGYDQKWERSSTLILEVLTKLKENNKFKQVLTHNNKGEYGHTHHIVTNRLVKEVFDKVFVFDRFNRLPDEAIAKKQELYKFYVSQKNVLKNNDVANDYFNYETLKEEK